MKKNEARCKLSQRIDVKNKATIHQNQTINLNATQNKEFTTDLTLYIVLAIVKIFMQKIIYFKDEFVEGIPNLSYTNKQMVFT